jgi:hypothetical protein
MDGEKKSFTFDELVGGSQTNEPPAKPVESAAKPKGMTLEEILGSSATAEQKPRRAEKSIVERGKEVLKETGIGGVAGFFAPEIMTGLGIAAAPTPFAPASPYLIGTGQALRATRGARALSAATGALGAAVGETAGQTVEAMDKPQYQAEIARLLGATLTPSVEGIVSRGGAIASKAASMAGFPSVGKARTIAKLLEDEGFSPSSLTQEQADFIQRKLDAVRGGRLPSLKAQQDISEMLRTGASSVTQAAEREAMRLEGLASQELQAASASARALDEASQRRVSSLQSQLEIGADKIRSSSQARANEILQTSKAKADDIISRAANESPNVRRIAQIDADAMIAQGRQRADQVLNASRQREQRLRDLSIRLRESAGKRVSAATAQLGEPKNRTDIGTDIRSSFDSVLQRLKAERDEAAKINRQQAFGEAFQKEAAGQNVTETAAAKNAIQEINASIINPVSGLKGVSEGALKQQLTSIKKAFEPEVIFNPQTGQTSSKSPSFENLEILRRSLRDRASGLPAEGFDAIGVGQAKRLADLIEAVQTEFSPGFGKYLASYRELSKPINKFSSDLGRAVTGKAEYDFTEFAVDPAVLADNLFSSRRGVQQLVNTVGSDQAETIARSYIQSRLGKGTAKEIDSVANDRKIQDWVGAFPRLQQELSAALSKRGQAERIAEKRKTLAGALRTEMNQLPARSAREAQTIEADLLRAAQRREAAGEKEAGRLMTQAEREAASVSRMGESAAERARQEGETQISQSARSVERQAERIRKQAESEAGAVTTQAERKAAELTGEAKKVRDAAESNARLLTSGDKAGEARVRDLILTDNEKELQETARVILSNPAGKEKFDEAVGQVFAELATRSPKSAAQRWAYVSQSLRRAGLISDETATAISQGLQDLLVTPVSQAEKSDFVKSFIRESLRKAAISYVAPAVERVTSEPVIPER